MNMNDHLKNKLQNHKVQWDKEKLLPGLKERLGHDPKPKRRYLWLLILLLVGGVLVGGVYMCYNSGQDQLSTQNSNLIAAQSDDKNTNDLSKESFTRDQRNTNQSQQESRIKNKLGDNEDSSNLSIISSVQSSEDDALNQASKSSITLNEPINHLGNKTIVQSKEQQFNSTIENQNPQNQINTINNIANADLSNLSNQYLQSKSTKNTSTDNDSKNQSTQVGTSIPLYTAVINPLKQSSWSLITLEKREFNLVLPLVQNTNLNSSDHQFSLPWFLSFDTAIGYAWRSRNHGTNNSDYLALLTENDKTEKTLFTSHTSLMLGYHHRTNISLSIGLEMQHIQEKLNYNSETVETLEIPTDEVAYFIVDQQDTTFVMQTSMVNRTTTQTVRNYNHHRFYSIPVQLGYQFDWKNTSFNATLGASYTFHHRYQGKVNRVSSNGNNQIIVADDRFRLKNRLGYHIGLAVEHPIRDHIKLTTNFAYRRTPTLGFGEIGEQHYRSVSVGVGLRYGFGG